MAAKGGSAAGPGPALNGFDEDSEDDGDFAGFDGTFQDLSVGVAPTSPQAQHEAEGGSGPGAGPGTGVGGMPFDADALMAGHLVKKGAVVKNWKKRWMILRTDGKLYYFKKQVPRFTDAEPRGVLDVQKQAVELLLSNEVLMQGHAKWPSSAALRSGFGLRTRQGRCYCFHAGSEEECYKWLAAIRKIGANLTFSDTTKLAMEAHGAMQDDWLKPLLSQEAAPNAGDDAGEGQSGDAQGVPVQKSYTHKVVGGVVIKSEILS